MISIKNMTLFALVAVAVVSPAAADTRMRRPRGERLTDAPRLREGVYGDEAGAYGDDAETTDIRMRRPRKERRQRLADAPRLREGVYGEVAGAYGEDATDASLFGPDVKDTCTTSLLDAVAATPDLSTLGVAVEAAGLEGALSDPTSTLTVLAPANSAFAEIDADVLAGLLEDPEALAGILTLHVIDGAVFASDLTDGMVVPTLSGGELTVSVSDEGVTFTSPSGVVSTVIAADVEVCSSVVHIIDAVLLP